MEAKEKSLVEVFGSGPQKLVVPFFQRRYVWDKENWDELLKSIEDNEDIKVFLGSIIIKWGENREPSEATIVDGQQRLTTLSLLTKAIYDEFSTETRSNVKATIQNVLFYKKNTTDDVNKSEIKIEHSRVDKDEYSYFIRAGVFNDEDVTLETIKNKCVGQIGKCYIHYREKLHDKKQEEISKIFNTMYNDNNKMIVRIVLQEKDVNEQSIFDTINRAGTRLSTADIIKNNLFRRFLESCNGDQNKLNEVYSIYDEKWDKTFYSTSGGSDWDKERYFGNVSRNNLEFLLYCVASIYWAKSDTKDFSSKLESVYAKETSGYGFAEYKNLILDIYEYANILSTFILKLNSVMSDKESKEHEYFTYSDDMRRLLMILEIYGIQMFYPYVLKIIKDANLELKNEELIIKAKQLESFVVRRRIIGSGTSDYTSKCNMILNKGVSKLFVQSGDDIIINDNEIKSSLKNIKSDTARLILFWIELSRKNKNSDIDGLTYTYTLEHIMPQKWQENWNVEEGLVENRQDHIMDIGNMTLLKMSLNSIVRNACFDIKINGIPAEDRKRSKEGYEGNVSLEITDEIVREYRNGNIIWDENRIDERRNRLSNEIIGIWPLYRVE